MKIDDLVKSSHHMILYIGDGNFKRMMLAAVKGCGNQVVIWNDNLGGGRRNINHLNIPGIILSSGRLLYVWTMLFMRKKRRKGWRRQDIARSICRLI